VDILEIEDVLKGLPDQALRQEAQQPSGQVPQYMVVSEIQRRSKMRKRFEAQKEQPSTTVAEQILTGGVASVAPPPPQMMGAMGMPQQPPAPPQQPPMGQQQPPMPPQQMPPQQPPMPQQGAPMPPPVQMAGGGVVKMASKGEVPYSNPQGLIVQALEEGVPGSVLIQQVPQFADLINQLEAQMLTKMGVDQYEDIKQDYIPYGREFDSDLASAPAGPMEEVVVTGQMPGPLEPRGQVASRALPQAEAVSPAARTIDTRSENLIFNQPTVSDPQYLSEDAQALRNIFSLTPEQQAGLSGGRIGMEATGGVFPPEEERKAMELARSRAKNLSGQIRSSIIDDFTSAPNFFSLTPEQEAGLRGGRIAMEAPGRLQSQTVRNFFMPEEQISSESIDKLIDQTAFVPTGSSDIDDLINQVDQIVVDPKQSSATQSDATKLNLDTATKSDGPLLSMALSEKSLTDYGYSDISMPALPDGIVLPKPKGTPDIQTQGIKYVSPDLPELVAPSFANMISEQERRLAKIREDAKRDVSAQALINLGAGVMEGDVAGGLRAAGEAASKVRTAERAAESDIANLQTRIKMAEEQGKFDTAKALRADALKEAQFEATFGLKRGELAQTLQLAEARIEAEGNTEKGRALRARLTALNDLASRLQAQVATTGIKDPATDAALQQALGQLQSLLGVKVADSDDSDPLGLKKTG
jgi:hypothetical protein